MTYKPDFSNLPVINYSPNRKYYKNLFVIESEVLDPDFYEKFASDIINIVSINSPLDDDFEDLVEDVFKRFYPLRKPIFIQHIASRPTTGKFAKVVIDAKTGKIFKHKGKK